VETLTAFWAAALPLFAQGVDVAPAFLNFGALGLMALSFGVAVRVLYQSNAKSSELERERYARVFDLEHEEKLALRAEVKELTQTMISQVVPALERSTLAIAELAKQRRDEGR
jgi:hypothetical protein